MLHLKTLPRAAADAQVEKVPNVDADNKIGPLAHRDTTVLDREAEKFDMSQAGGECGLVPNVYADNKIGPLAHRDTTVLDREAEKCEINQAGGEGGFNDGDSEATIPEAGNRMRPQTQMDVLGSLKALMEAAGYAAEDIEKALEVCGCVIAKGDVLT